MTQEQQEYERPYLQIPVPPRYDPNLEEYLREKEKEEAAKLEESGSVIIIDM